jgi:NADH-quinone oxidoreductase subunit J
MLADAPVFSPVLLLVLCAVAGFATVLMLPGNGAASFRKIGGFALLVVGLIFLSSVPSWIAEGSGHAPAFYFWMFSAIAVVGALRVVTHAKPVYSALYFVLTIFASAGLFVLMEAEFMAAALVIIYAGAILVTYVFVIMLASQATGTGNTLSPMADYDSHSREPLAAAAIGFAMMGTLLFVIFNRAEGLAEPFGAIAMLPNNQGPQPVVEGATQELGLYLFQHQLVQLELAGIILVVSMVGAIVISRRKVTLTPGTTARVEPETIATPDAPVDDNPHSIPVYGNEVRRVKERV